VSKVSTSIAMITQPRGVKGKKENFKIYNKKRPTNEPEISREFQEYIREGRFENVEPLLEAYVKEHPKSTWGWYALGYSQFAQRKIGESIQALAKSLEFDVRNAEAHKILGRDLMIVGRLDAA